MTSVNASTCTLFQTCSVYTRSHFVVSQWLLPVKDLGEAMAITRPGFPPLWHWQPFLFEGSTMGLRSTFRQNRCFSENT